MNHILPISTFLGSHCVKPPVPPSEHNLQLQWNSDYPPAHGETVLYICNAGADYNRFQDNFYAWNMSITCELNNTFSSEPNVQWPTCLNGSNQLMTFPPLLIKLIF